MPVSLYSIIVNALIDSRAKIPDTGTPPSAAHQADFIADAVELHYRCILEKLRAKKEQTA
jgi:hypothetical protein